MRLLTSKDILYDCIWLQYSYINEELTVPLVPFMVNCKFSHNNKEECAVCFTLRRMLDECDSKGISIIKDEIEIFWNNHIKERHSALSSEDINSSQNFFKFR